VSDDKDKAAKAPSDAEDPSAEGNGPDDAVDPQVVAEGADGDGETEAPVGHPPPATAPLVLPEAAPRPKRKGGKKGTATITYSGPADVFTYTTADGEAIKFRPGVPTEIGAGDVDELLTYPGHTFAETADAEEEQEKDDGNT